MGWKRGLIAFLGCKISMLSENQCGMETRAVPSNKDSIDFVEREPMWDGNFFEIIYSCRNRVEREPMWDGNISQS